MGWREDTELLHDSDETDDVIFLLSTDWFTSWIVSLGQWSGGQGSIEHTKSVARRAASGILSGVSDYYYVDLSPARKAASFDRFMRELGPNLDEQQARDFDRLLSLISGDSLLSQEQRWALKAVLIREMSCGFGSDARAALGEGVLVEVMRTLELLGVGEIPFQPESSWDVELDRKFGGLAGRLEDYASSAYAPNVLLQAVGGVTRRLHYGPLDVELLADWWAGAAQEFSMHVDPRGLAAVLTKFD